MTTRRAAAKAEAAVMIDIEARLAPFFRLEAPGDVDRPRNPEPVGV